MRPVIVFKKIGKYNFLGIPLTSKIKNNQYRLTINFQDRINNALLNQVRVFDSKRLQYKIGHLSKEEFIKVEKKFVSFYNLTLQKEGGILTNCEQRKDDKIISQKNKNVKVSIITVTVVSC